MRDMNWLVVLLAQPQKLNSMWDDELSASLKELTGSEVPTLLLVKSLSNIYLLCHFKYFLATICSLIFSFTSGFMWPPFCSQLLRFAFRFYFVYSPYLPRHTLFSLALCNVTAFTAGAQNMIFRWKMNPYKPLNKNGLFYYPNMCTSSLFLYLQNR